MMATRKTGFQFMAALLICFFASIAAAEETTVHLSFVTDQVVEDSMEGYDVLSVKAPSTMLDGPVGAPLLPVKEVNVVIPAGAVLDSVVQTSESVVYGSFRLFPAQRQVHPGEEAEFANPDPVYYTLETKYPAEPIEMANNGTMRGYNLVTIKVFPLQYIPASGKVYLNREMDITVRYTLNPHVSLALDAHHYDPSFEQMVKGMVENPDDVEGSLPAKTAASPVNSLDVKYLIITKESLRSSFQALADWKTAKGAPAEIVSVETIRASYSGVDDQTKIKNCIVDYYNNFGLVYVLLGGDDTVVPDRDCYVAVGSEVESHMPTDLYYAGLDDVNWNDNNDSQPCNTNDSIDLLPDVWVGRAPVRSTADVAAFVNKTINYDKNPPASNFAERMLLMGTMLFGPAQCSGCLGYKDGRSDADWKSEALYSQYVDPYWDFGRNKFYDTGTSFSGNAGYDLNTANVKSQLNSGYNFVFMATHGNWNIWAMETSGQYFRQTDALALTNGAKQGHIYTMACLTSYFDGANDPSLGEAFLRNPNGGAVSYIGCSRYGWGTPYYGSNSIEYHGTSIAYADRFYFYTFSNDTYGHDHHLGAIFGLHKKDMAASSASAGAFRWVQFGLNLLGDPELYVHTEDPHSFAPTFSANINSGAQAYTVTTGVANALVCLRKGAEVYAYGKTTAAGSFTTQINPATAGTMQITISRYNYTAYQGSVTVSVVSEGGGGATTVPGQPTTVTPLGKITASQPTFTWNAVSGATLYVLQVVDRSGVLVYSKSLTASSVTSGSTCSVTPSDKLSNDTYKWRVQAGNSAGSGYWSMYKMFTVASTDTTGSSSSSGSVPGQATTISPLGKVTTITPTFSWTAVSGATSYVLEVRDRSRVLVYSQTLSSSSLSKSGTTYSTTPSNRLLKGATYTWRLQAKNSAGSGYWSTYKMFTIAK